MVSKNNYEDAIKVFREHDHNVILFGASSGGEGFITNTGKRSMKEYNILAVADNDKKKQGGNLLGVPIISPSQISMHKYDKIIITSRFFLGIEEQLIGELGINKDDIMLAPKC
ncbi:MAG: hypothetical protein GX992_02455 [Clostridium sp.]|nr:hypothetical protein [Clostridium sp.]